jgi:uncharacterized protein (TIGR01244 family)
VIKTIFLEPGFAVCGQISAADFPGFAGAGIKTILNNRPDGEAPDQLSSGEAASLAARYQIAYQHLPMTMPTLNSQLVEEFALALETLPSPILAHCRSGTRSTMLWALARVSTGKYSADTAIHMASAAGYDIEGLRPVLEHAEQNEIT